MGPAVRDGSRRAGGYLILTSSILAAALLGVTAHGPAPAEPTAVKLAYRYVVGETIRQTTRQSQAFTSAGRPDLDGESTTVSRGEALVRDVDANGAALLDEITTYEGDEEKRDHRRFRTSPLGEILWVDIISGEPSALQGGAIFVDRYVRPGDAWRTRMKGSGGGPSYVIDLVVVLDAIAGSGPEATARLKLSGRMPSATVTSMLGDAGVAQGIRGRECRVSGEVVFLIRAGKEISSNLDLDCNLELLGESGPPAEATLRISYVTTNDGPLIPRVEAP